MSGHTTTVRGNNEETFPSAQLPILKRDKLLDLWNDLIKSSAPAAISRQLLERGYRLYSTGAPVRRPIRTHRQGTPEDR